MLFYDDKEPKSEGLKFFAAGITTERKKTPCEEKFSLIFSVRSTKRTSAQ